MTASHLSLRDDFEVSCKELDILVDAAINCNGAGGTTSGGGGGGGGGVLGSRMTGGGFGGCTVTLLYKKNTTTVIEHMQTVYGKHGRKASFYVCEPSEGSRLINMMRSA